LDGMNRASLTGYLRENYVAANCLIVAAGKTDHRRLAAAVSRQARRFATAKGPVFAPTLVRQTAPQLRLFTKMTEQTQMALGIRACSRHDPRRYALRLLNTLLGENSSSRLFQTVREDRGLAYSIYSSPSYFDDTGDLVISAGLDTDNLPRTLRLVLGELRRLTKTPPGAAELRRTRDYVIGQMELGLESTEGQMNWLGEQWMGYGRFFQLPEVKRRLQSVTPEQIRSAARDFFRPDCLNLALVSPLKNDRTLTGILRRELSRG